MTIQNDLLYEIDWRIEEIALIKTNHLSVNISPKRCEIIRKYAAVSIYALLEGFVVNALRLYIDEINRNHVCRNSLDIRIVNEYLQNCFDIHTQRVKSKAQIALVRKLEDYYSADHHFLSKKVNTEANVNVKVINKLLSCYNLEIINNQKITNGLNKLLQYRNSIAHGETSINIDNDVICEFADIVTETMDLIYDSIMQGVEKKSYIRNEEESELNDEVDN